MYGLVDCNNFYCSCERVFRPDLNGRPVVVLSNNDGCVIARSNESKALGIDMGIPFYQAKPLIERYGVAVFSSNYNLYGDMSRRVMSLLARYTPDIDVYSIDEAFITLDGIDADEMRQHGERIVRVITKGTGIPVSLGIAPTKTLAKMASKYAKKYAGYHGVCIIDSEDARLTALRLFDIADVWGIGRRHAKSLRSRGINTAYDFAAMPADWVRRRYAVTGLRTWRELNGHDCIDTLAPERKQSICTSRSFPDRGLSRRADVEEAIANFAAACCRKLREQRSVCQAMAVYAHTSQFREDMPARYIQRHVTFDTPTSNLGEMVDAAVKALRSAWTRDGEYYYKKGGVLVWSILPDTPLQLSLFDSVDRDKTERLQKAVDAINVITPSQVRVAAQGVSQAWRLKNQYLSRRYTTDLNDVIALSV